VAAPTATLEVERQYVWSGWGLQYAVFVDAVKVGLVENPRRFDPIEKRGGPGHKVAVSIAAGPHTVQLKSFWYASKKLQVNPVPGETIKLTCYQRRGPITLMLPRQAITLAVAVAS
jgi:hypothetical protein